jgi:hypothetical protein
VEKVVIKVFLTLRMPLIKLVDDNFFRRRIQRTPNAIAYLAIWCMAFNVNKITLYDIDGILKNEKKQIEKILLRKLPKAIHQSHTFIWNANDALCGEDSFPTSQSHNNSDGEKVKTTKVISKLYVSQ